MKIKIFNIIIIFICIFILVELFIKKSLIYSSVIYALNMWVNNLIPALFPFFIISDILINYNISNYIPKIFRDLCKYIWGISDKMFTILVLSMISGFPSNARNTRTLYDKGEISLDEANHILIFSHYSNPVFILVTVGTFFFSNERVGVILLITHYLSNFILGLLCRGMFKHDSNNGVSKDNKANSFGGVFVNAIKKSVDTTLLICGILVVFLMLSSIVVDMFNFSSYNSMIIKGLFEITIGIEALGSLNVSNIYKAVIASCFLAFGGISVHTQVLSQIVGTKIRYGYFFVGRLFQMIIAGVITYIICVIVGI